MVKKENTKTQEKKEDSSKSNVKSKALELALSKIEKDFVLNTEIP